MYIHLVFIFTSQQQMLYTPDNKNNERTMRVTICVDDDDDKAETFLLVVPKK